MREKTNIRVRTLVLACCFLTGMPRAGHADALGGDLIILGQILSNSVQQLIQLRQILSSGQDNFHLLQDVNRGINDALGVIHSVGALRDPGLYRDLRRVPEALQILQSLYGVAVDSSETKVQQHTDQTVAEAIALNNSIYSYAQEMDQIGEDIKRHSSDASPKGAQKLTVQSLGVLVHVMDQSLRAQATGLKLQAQAMAIQNRKDKVYSDQVRRSSEQLDTAMKSMRPEFKLPRL